MNDPEFLDADDKRRNVELSQRLSGLADCVGRTSCAPNVVASDSDLLRDVIVDAQDTSPGATDHVTAPGFTMIIDRVY